MQKSVKTPAQVLGENIRALRKAKRWTQLQLGVEIGNKSGSTIQGIEIGVVQGMPQEATIQAIAKALGTTKETLLRGTEPEKATQSTDMTFLQVSKDDLKNLISEAVNKSGNHTQHDDDIAELLDAVRGLDRRKLRTVINFARGGSESPSINDRKKLPSRRR